MRRAQIELDEKLVVRAERLARQRGITIEQLLAELVDAASRPIEGGNNQILGLFNDESDLMDQIVEDALHSREKQPLRLPRG